MLDKIECVYEPAMSKSFLHGQTEVICSVQPESMEFVLVVEIISHMV